MNTKITIIFGVLVLSVVLGVGVYVLLPTTIIQPQPITATTSIAIIATTSPTTVSMTTNGLKTYRNNEWGFEFEYPEGFIIKEKAFVSYYSKFNLRVLHKIGDGLERAIVVNVVSPEFIEQSFSGLDKKIKEVTIDGVLGVEYEYEFNERHEKVVILPFGGLKLILGQHYEEYDELLTK